MLQRHNSRCYKAVAGGLKCYPRPLVIMKTNDKWKETDFHDPTARPVAQLNGAFKCLLVTWTQTHTHLWSPRVTPGGPVCSYQCGHCWTTYRSSLKLTGIFLLSPPSVSPLPSLAPLCLTNMWLTCGLETPLLSTRCEITWPWDIDISM